MARLPIPGSDDGSWGNILNDYLAQVHDTDGTLKDNIVTEAKLASAVQTKLNAPATVADDSLTPAKLSSDTAVDGELLSYNGGNFEWITPAAGGGGGEVNTASNIGTAGVGIYKQKTGVNFELKKLNGGSSKVTVTNDAANNEIDIDVVEANLTLTKSQVGLANVDNTSDANKPVSTATQTALNLKATDTLVVHLAGAETVTGVKAFSASPTVPTPSSGTQAANKTYVDTAVAGGGGGTSRFTTVARTTGYTAADYNFVIGDASTAGFTVTLPAAIDGGWVRVKKVDATGNAIVVAPASGQIDNLASDVVNSQWQSQDYASDGTKWYRI